MRPVGHVPAVRGVEQEGDGRVGRAAIRVLLGEAYELAGDAAQRVELERVLAGAGLEELVEALFEVDGRCAGHVVEVVAFPIPRKRRPRRRAVARVEEMIRAGEV